MFVGIIYKSDLALNEVNSKLLNDNDNIDDYRIPGTVIGELKKQMKPVKGVSPIHERDDTGSSFDFSCSFVFCGCGG
jgi:hypothetical protein